MPSKMVPLPNQLNVERDCPAELYKREKGHEHESKQVCSGRLTIDKEQMRASVSRSAREILYDTIHILGRWHQQVYCFESWLRLAITCDRFNHCLNKRQVHSSRVYAWYSQVTFSSKISNCLRTEFKNFCECSSTTSIFHLPGGLTDRIASRNSGKDYE